MSKQFPSKPFDLMSPPAMADMLLQTSVQALASSPELVELLKRSRREQGREAVVIPFPRLARSRS